MIRDPNVTTNILRHGDAGATSSGVRSVRHIMMPRGSVAKAAAALLCLALYLFVQALGTSSELHRDVHSDAGSEQHQCAATALASGQVLVPAAGLAAITPPPVVVLIAQPSELVFLPSSDRRLQPGRAPPFLSA
jgi:hypothetical protein